MTLRKLALLAAGLLLATSALASYRPSQILVFGDGISDNGNTFNAKGVPQAPYWHGRFSSGPSWVEDLAYSYLLIPDPWKNPRYNKSSRFEDYAFQNAVVLWKNRPAKQPARTLDQEVSLFLTHKNTVKKNSLAIFWLGATDLTNQSCINKPFRCVNNVIINYENNMNRVRKAGVSHFLVLLTPDVSLTPKFMTKFAMPNVREQVHGLINYFNNNLNLVAFEFGKKYNVPVTIVNTAVPYQRLARQFKLNTQVPCINSTTKTVCKNPNSSDHFYFDDYYPTARAQYLLSNVVRDVLSRQK